MSPAFLLSAGLLLLSCTKGATAKSCFEGHACDGENIDFACLQNHWACTTDEFCQQKIDHQGSTEVCKHENEFLGCLQSGNANPATCDPRLPNTFGHEQCFFCCRTAQCFLDLTVLPFVAPTQAPVVHPADHSCYTSECHKGRDNLATCSSGTWACAADEFCSMHLDNRGLQMECKHLNDEQQCTDNSGRNSMTCDPTLIEMADHEGTCSYCCRNDACVKGLTSQSVTSQAPLVTATASVVSSCYTSPCNNGEDLATCMSGQWACLQNQFCEVHLSVSSGNVTMLCVPSIPEIILHCEQRAALEYCRTAEDHLRHDCHYCCPNSHCVGTIAPLLNTTPPPTTTTTLPADCQDLYSGDCAADYGTQCSSPVVQQLCPRTCHACHGAPTTSTAVTAAPTTTTPPTTPQPGSHDTLSCYVCDGLFCLTEPNSQYCPTDRPICYTLMTDTQSHGRFITRGCIATTECQVPSAICQDAQNRELPAGTVCTFCCITNNCNDPLLVVPTSGRFPGWP